MRATGEPNPKNGKTQNIVNIKKITDNKNKLRKLYLKENTNYNNLDNKFELKQFEKIIVNDLTNKLINKIHFALSTIK